MMTTPQNNKKSEAGGKGRPAKQQSSNSDYAGAARKALTCFNCGKPGHKRQDCKEAQTEKKGKGRGSKGGGSIGEAVKEAVTIAVAQADGATDAIAEVRREMKEKLEEQPAEIRAGILTTVATKGEVVLEGSGGDKVVLVPKPVRDLEVERLECLRRSKKISIYVSGKENTDTKAWAFVLYSGMLYACVIFLYLDQHFVQVVHMVIGWIISYILWSYWSSLSQTGTWIRSTGDTGLMSAEHAALDRRTADLAGTEVKYLNAIITVEEWTVGRFVLTLAWLCAWVSYLGGGLVPAALKDAAEDYTLLAELPYIGRLVDLGKCLISYRVDAELLSHLMSRRHLLPGTTDELFLSRTNKVVQTFASLNCDRYECFEGNTPALGALRVARAYLASDKIQALVGKPAFL